jgi:hypothetical protein
VDAAWVPVAIGALLGAGGLGALLKSRAESVKIHADAEVTLGGGWQILVGELRVEVNELRERVAVEERRADASEVREALCQDRLADIERRTEHVSEEHVERVVASVIDTELQKRGMKP